MAVAEIQGLAQSGAYDKFEARCLELLEQGQLTLAQLVAPFAEIERAGKADRLPTLTQMVFETVSPATDPAAALALARSALIGAPGHAELRQKVIDLYRQLYGGKVRFDVILEASGLNGGRPVRNALRLLDLCLTLEPGDALISRMDDKVVEVTGIDRERGLFTLKREGRVTTLPAQEVVREYERIAADDFRLLRQLHPDRIVQLITEDPVKVVVGLIRAHGGQIDADLLKHELVPRYLPSKDWSKWWTSTRAHLKKSPNVAIVGRAPVILQYQENALSLEQDFEARLRGQRDPLDWLPTIEGYLREKAARGESPDATLLGAFHDHLANHVRSVQARRPAEALTTALILLRLTGKGLPGTDETRGLAATLLREAADPGLLLRGVPNEALRELGMEVLQTARPDDWVQYALAWLPTAGAGLLDKIATATVGSGQTAAVQSFIDYGLNDLAAHPELVYWLWKGPKQPGLVLPSDADLFRMILDALSTLGRSITIDAEVLKEFRQRIKAALALRDYEKVRRVFQQTSEAAAIPIKHRLQRLEGLGENAPARMLDLLRETHPQLWVVTRERVAPWADPDTIWATAAGIARRTAERDEIINVKMPENARRIGEAASHGDLSENSEYKFALEERDLLRARLATMNDELSRTQQLELHHVPSGHVGIGTRVQLRLSDGTERVMTFFGPYETDVERGVYSYQAPVSQKLMGGRVGERVTVVFDGHDTDLEILAIENALPDAGG